MFELAAPFRGVRKVAVVAERHFALVAVDQDRLSIQQRFVACRGIARVPDGEFPGNVFRTAG